jgi:hypothetical protein
VPAFCALRGPDPSGAASRTMRRNTARVNEREFDDVYNGSSVDDISMFIDYVIFHEQKNHERGSINEGTTK